MSFAQSCEIEDLQVNLKAAKEKLAIAKSRLHRYEHALSNIETMIDGKADYCSDKGPNLEMQIQVEIDEAREGR